MEEISIPLPLSSSGWFMTRVFITSAGVPIVAAAKAAEILDMACVICRKVELYTRCQFYLVFR